MQRVALVIICSWIAASPLLALFSAAPDADGPVLVIAPPWVDLTKVVEAAGGNIIGLRAAPMGVLAVSADDSFQQGLKSQGVWAVLDGQTLAFICGVKV